MKIEIIEAQIEDLKTDIRDYVGDADANKLYLAFLTRLLELEKRNAILEAAVAFKGFDEVPEGGIFRVIELRRADGKINNGQKINFDRYKNNGDYTGWRYPVGDLSE